jgi:predicted ATPase with chaperone activity
VYALQQVRLRRKAHVLVNGDMRLSEVQKFCQLYKEELAMIRMAVEYMGLSVRAYPRVLKLSRTIADSAGIVAVQQTQRAVQRQDYGVGDLHHASKACEYQEREQRNHD